MRGESEWSTVVTRRRVLVVLGTVGAGGIAAGVGELVVSGSESCPGDADRPASGNASETDGNSSSGEGETNDC